MNKQTPIYRPASVMLPEVGLRTVLGYGRVRDSASQLTTEIALQLHNAALKPSESTSNPDRDIKDESRSRRPGN